MTFNDHRKGIYAISRVACVVVVSIYACSPPGARERFAISSAALNPVATENALPGVPQSTWDLTGSSDPTLQGFATDMSVNVGQRITFKVAAQNTYHIEIYRIGYYAGNGARLIAQIPSLQVMPQPGCLSDPDTSTKLVDCGNWAPSAFWDVPTTATSGVHVAKLVREDGLGASQIVFVVRNDNSPSDIVVQTSDATWQAYNQWGDNPSNGASLYGGPSGAAVKVSYNRPFGTRASAKHNFFFDAEFALVRWLERNGYDVSYISEVDTARMGNVPTQPANLLLNHKVFISSGHDEYWSADARTNVEAARAQGVNLMFLSGNESYWKTRWENSIHVSPGTPYRTLVCYRGNLADPSIHTSWTGTWRDPNWATQSPGDMGVVGTGGPQPEYEMTGTWYRINGDGSGEVQRVSMQVPGEDARLRLWRNTSLSTTPGFVTTLQPLGVLGYEFDEPGKAPPAGLIRVSHTPFSTNTAFVQGDESGGGSVIHSATMYRAG